VGGLFLFFSVIQNVINHPSLSLLAIIVVAVSLLFFQGMVGGVYKLVYLNFLECFFLVNLICFSGSTFYTAQTNGNQAASVYMTVGLAFVVLIVVVVHGDKLATSKSTQLSTKIWVKLLLLLENALKLYFEAL